MSRLETVELHHQAPQHFLLRFAKSANQQQQQQKQQGGDNKEDDEEQRTSVVSVCSLNQAGAGGDALARHCIFPLLLKQRRINVVIRDDLAAQSSKNGTFTPATLDLTDLCSDVRTISDPETRAILCHLFRKQCVMSHGAVVLSKVTKVISTGRRALALKIAGSGVAAVAALPASLDTIDFIKSLSDHALTTSQQNSKSSDMLGGRIRDALGEDIFVDYNANNKSDDDDEDGNDDADAIVSSSKNKSNNNKTISPGDSISARILYIASDTGLVVCSVQRDVVNRGPVTRQELERSFRSVGAAPGKIVRARVLLHCSAEDKDATGIASHIAVAEISAEDQRRTKKQGGEDDDEDEDDENVVGNTDGVDEPSVLCFVRLGPSAQAAKLRESVPVGSAIDVLLQFVPGPAMLDALPVCVGIHAPLVKPSLPLRPFSRDMPFVPLLLAACASGSGPALAAAASSSSINSKAAQTKRQQLSAPRPILFFGDTNAETQCLNDLFRPLQVSFQNCDPLFIDSQASTNKNNNSKSGLQFDDEDDNGEEEDGNKKPGAGGSRIRRRELEEAIDAFERQGEIIPTTDDGFRKLLLSAPQSSYVWIRFAAHLVGLSKIDEARNVLEEALRTLGVRELQERVNVWTAYLNLENLHGTAESLESVFNRALLNSDNQRMVYERLAHIFKATKKRDQLLQLCRTMTGRFGSEPSVWELLGKAYIDQDKREALRKTVRMIQSSPQLKMADKTLVLQHLAVYEYRVAATTGSSSSSSSSAAASGGQAVHGRALFETLVSQKAKRSDVWSVYIDQELGLLARKDPAVSVKDVRKLFQRATSVQLPPHAMKQLMGRFLKFEQQHGTAADAERVKQAAQRYVSDRLAAAGTTAVTDEAVAGRRGGAAVRGSIDDNDDDGGDQNGGDQDLFGGGGGESLLDE